MSSRNTDQPELPRSHPQFYLVPPDRLGLKCDSEDKRNRLLGSITGSHWDARHAEWTFPRTRETLEDLLAVFRTDWRILDRKVADAFGFNESPNTKVVPARRSDPATPSVLEVLRRELTIRNYSPKTIKTYMSCVRSFEEYSSPASLKDLTSEDLRDYMLYQIEERKLSAGTISQIINSIRFLYVEVLKLPFDIGELERPRRGRKLPVVLSQAEVRALLE